MNAGMKPKLTLPFSNEPGAKKRRPLEGARVLLGEAKDEPAGSARSILIFQGAREVTWRRNISGMEEALEDSLYDLVLIDRQLPGGDALDFVRKLWRGEIGENPFVCLAVLRWQPGKADVDAALQSGADDLIAKPIAAMAVATRMKLLCDRRKPYIAAEGYIGPIRAQMSMGLSSAEQFEPPNTLKATAIGKPLDAATLKKALSEANQNVSAAIIETAAAKFSAYAFSLKDAIDDEDQAEAATLTGKLKETGATVRSAVEGSPHVKLLPVILRLNALVDLAQFGEKDASRAAALTAEMADAVARTLKGRPDDISALTKDLLGQIAARFPAIAAAVAEQESAEASAETAA